MGLLDMPKEVVVTFLAAFFAVVGTVVLVFLKIALWLVVIVGLILFMGLLAVFSVVAGVMAARRVFRRPTTTTELSSEAHESAPLGPAFDPAAATIQAESAGNGDV